MEQQNEHKNHIAIVGMSCRFPGIASTIDGYWQLLSQGSHVLSDIPVARFDVSKHFDLTPDMPNKTYVKKGAFIDSVSEFDAQFFGISSREAVAMDPQQRLLLECSWEALEDSGVAPDTLNNSKTGVFVGCIDSEYRNLLEASKHCAEYEPLIPTGAFTGAVAGRLSYTLGLTGPSIVIDTHYSASLVALHMACQSLLNNECEKAIAAGVHLILSPEGYILFSRNHTLSPDGYSKTFDIDANGFGRGEGCGVLVLKRLTDAIQDNDRIHAVILGSVVNHDGRGISMAAPNQQAQENLLREALHRARVKPNQIGYIEAHGTGTPLGDPTELDALCNVFRNCRTKYNPLYIGSVKTNIGHLEAAAGIAGVIKTVLSLKHKQIPAHLHFNKLSPNINLDAIPAHISTTLTSWSPIEKRRIAGVSSFGITGTNAHIIIEEAPSKTVIKKDKNIYERPKHILTISAKSTKALQNLSKKHLVFLQQNNSISDIGYSANNFRSKFGHRLAIVSSDVTDAKIKLQKWLDFGQADGIISSEDVTCNKPKIAFVFTGQGAQYVGMGHELYITNLTFKNALDDCTHILNKYNYLDKPLLSLLWGDNKSLLNETKYTQPAMFALEYALYKLWSSWGVIPTAVMGHSLGEYVAACVAGVFSLEDGLKLISKRAALMQALPKNGSMLAIEVSEQIALDAIKPYKDQVAIAAINEPRNVVISGDTEIIKKLIIKFTTTGIKAKELQVSHAFHSHLLEPMLHEFASILRGVKLLKPNIPVISNLTGTEITAEEITTIDYWIKHTRHAVRFSAGISSLINMGINCLIEIGPQPVLLAMAHECLVDSHSVLLLPSLHKDKNNWEQILESLSKLFVCGSYINWKNFDEGYNRYKVELPTYEFDRQKYWLYIDKSNAENVNNNSPHYEQDLIQNLSPNDSFFDRFILAAPENRNVLIQSMLQQEIKHILRIDPNIELDINEKFETLGLDSLLMIEFRNSLKKKFNGILDDIINKPFTLKNQTIAATNDALTKAFNSKQHLPSTTNQQNIFKKDIYASTYQTTHNYRISSEWIKVDKSIEDVPLFGWDNFFMEYQYIPMGYLLDGQIDFELFKNNLMVALNTIPLYAGRVIKNIDNKNVISIKNSKGVLVERYVEVMHDAPIAGHVSKKQWQHCFEWKPINRHIIHNNSESPLLAIKVIEFPKTNKTVVCIYYSHIVGDMKTVNLFVKNICNPNVSNFDLSRKYQQEEYNSDIKPLTLHQAILETIKLLYYYTTQKIEIIVPLSKIKELTNMIKEYRHGLKYYELIDLREAGTVHENFVGNPIDYREFDLLHIDTLLEDLALKGKLNTIFKRFKWGMVRVGAGGILFDNMIFDQDNSALPNFGTSNRCLSVKLSDKYDHPNLPIIYQREKDLYVMRVSTKFFKYLNSRGVYFNKLPN